MEIEVSAEAKDKRLNRRVVVTVVILSVFIGPCGFVGLGFHPDVLSTLLG